MGEATSEHGGRRLLMAFYPDADRAGQALEALMRRDFPMDRASLLGQASSSGDDPLGVYYPSAGERMKGWGKMGAFWGGVWGLLTGAAGMFLVPGIGPLLAAGPVVEALVGAAGGAALTGGALAGAGALSQVGVAVHRMGVPQERIEETRGRLAQGEHLLLLIVGEDELEPWREALGSTEPRPLWDFPYVGLREAASGGA
jgi:hypothetical protein